MKVAKYTILGVVAGMALLAFAVALNTVRVASPVMAAEADGPAAGSLSDREVAERVDRLAGALLHPTISTPDTAAWDDEAFEAFRAYLEGAFPRIHARLTRTVLRKHTLLFEWTGTRPELGPLVLMAHQDVVPVAAETEGETRSARSVTGTLR